MLQKILTGAGSILLLAAGVRSDTTVTLDGKTFVNKGLVGFGLIPSNFTESTGDTLGGIGSAIAVQPGTFKKNSDGTFAGVLAVNPDRGYNVEDPINYQSRQHLISFVLTPYEDSDPLSFEAAQKTLQVNYESTTLRLERGGKVTTGLDGTAARTKSEAPAGIQDPPVPIASSKDDRLTLDIEGIAFNADGTYWVSDEYGPYIYLYTPSGNLLHVIQPPAAIQPLDKSGNLDFTSLDDPKTGRQANQGFEGLSISRSKNTLYALLQSATIQDGGDDKSTARYTRLLGWDVSGVSTETGEGVATLVEEYVVPLPLSDKGNAQGASEALFVGEGVFLILARDGDGQGGDDNNSKYRQADLVSILPPATNIANTEFDSPMFPIAKDGVLNKTITPAAYLSFVDMIDDDELERFGVHNGKPSDPTLLDAKWESLALAPALDDDFPDDYFLFTASDNDFLSTQGVSLGVPFDAGLDVANQFMVFRVTLPGAEVYV